CDLEAPKHRLLCDACRRMDDARKEVELVAKAKRVSLVDYELDYVFIDDRIVSIDALDEETCVFWAVTAERGIKLVAHDILESECEDRHEDAVDDLDIESLQAVLDAWCAEQNIVTYRARDDLIVDVAVFGGGL